MTAPRRLHLILHGKAAIREDVRAAIGALREQGHAVDVSVTFEAGDAARFTHQGMERVRAGETDVIVAAGGDGTLNEVVAAGLSTQEGGKEGATFALWPLGTANDFAQGLGLPAADLRAGLRLCAEGKVRTIDAGSVNGRYFINLASGGTATRITAETDPAAKRLLGGAAYLIAGVSRIGDLTLSHACFSSESFCWEGEFVAMAAGNGRQAGGGIVLCPHARIDDGELDLTIVPLPDADGIRNLVGGLLRDGRNHLPEFTETVRFRELLVESAAPLSVNLDGEPMSADRLEIKVHPGAVRFVTGDGPR
ncbi:lipid kinase YegS [Stappia taiwanensis]|uniref:Lipid kinase YegS n=1 Tax=Stappia taiwanensis TaxID=992267 RepID=A0A838XNB5_9HYPH|nr:lipid kinase YegS [Stappia taiwanensis]MBA4610501.1 lipid kinase YegS [Stappia taiwanensis]GGE84401.1 putative lipid kinase YegS-like protein [Stappia taiwanensis]